MVSRNASYVIRKLWNWLQQHVGPHSRAIVWIISLITTVFALVRGASIDPCAGGICRMPVMRL